MQLHKKLEILWKPKKRSRKEVISVCTKTRNFASFPGQNHF